MIQANELRIGNVVRLNNKGWEQFSGKLCAIRQVSLNANEYYAGLKVLGELSLTDRCVGDLSQFLEYIEPVEITPEILEKCGFEKMSDRWENEIDIYEYREGIYRLCLDEYGILSLDIKHLQQLQNLYFALTGKELSINI